MKTLKEFILEEQSLDDDVYTVYFNDGTMYNFFESEDEANKIKEKLNAECEDNKCTVKKEKKSSIQQKPKNNAE